MKMTVLRTFRDDQDDMGVDIDNTTDVLNVDIDHGGLNDQKQVTIYGTETNGQLYYVVLDLELVRHIQSLPRL